MTAALGPGPVQVQRRDAFGIVRVYPVNAAARMLCELSGKRTLTLEDLQLIERLGFTLEWVPLTVEVSK